jgi:hypothetical protein
MYWQKLSLTGCTGKAACPQPQLKFDDFLQYFARPSDLKNVAKILDAENLEIGAILKYGLISMRYWLDDAVFKQRSAMCFACWVAEVAPQIVDSRFTAGTVLLAGVQVLSHLPSQSVPRELCGNRRASAFFEIARQIGLSFAQLADDDAESPFTVTVYSASR